MRYVTPARDLFRIFLKIMKREDRTLKVVFAKTAIFSI
jgi:hypothetical protein